MPFLFLFSRRICAGALLVPVIIFAQKGAPLEIPPALSSLSYNEAGKLTLAVGGQKLVEANKADPYTLTQMLGRPAGTDTGIALDFDDVNLNGTVAYGPYNVEAEFPTVAFLAKSSKITAGKALLEFKTVFKGPNDFFKLADRGSGIVGFRVIDSAGRILYEGRVAFKGKGPYEVLPTIVEGPFINQLGEAGCVVSYDTQVPTATKITVDGRTFEDAGATTHHELSMSGLQPATSYRYEINYGERIDRHIFKTAPRPGSRTAFTFAFASANRATTGGGERDFGGTNYSSSRAVTAAAVLNHAVFMQASGDITTGENASEGAHLLEYSNWKRALEPFWAGIPVYVGFGDHEDNFFSFPGDAKSKRVVKIDRFPYASDSGEAIFAKAFVHPTNGPERETFLDGKSTVADFPPYSENVYYYQYDNVAMLVLNTEYWKGEDPRVSGSPEGYIMDRQFLWLKETVEKLEKDPSIDHIFVNTHSAVFPNGDHANGAMWYDGKNTERAKMKGVPVGVGILERRDQILDLCINKSDKFVAFLSGDEHNFAFLEVSPDFPLYPDDYALPKIKLRRTVFHINNGGGGSAPYAMLPTPWSGRFKFFVEPPTVALISVHGKSVILSAFRAETFGKICEGVALR